MLTLAEQLGDQLFDARYALADALETLHAMGARAGLQQDEASQARGFAEARIRQALALVRTAADTTVLPPR